MRLDEKDVPIQRCRKRPEVEAHVVGAEPDTLAQFYANCLAVIVNRRLFFPASARKAWPDVFDLDYQLPRLRADGLEHFLKRFPRNRRLLGSERNARRKKENADEFHGPNGFGRVWHPGFAQSFST